MSFAEGERALAPAESARPEGVADGPGAQVRGATPAPTSPPGVATAPAAEAPAPAEAVTPADVRALVARYAASSDAENNGLWAEICRLARTGSTQVVLALHHAGMQLPIEYAISDNPNLEVVDILYLRHEVRTPYALVRASERIGRIARTSTDPTTLRTIAFHADFHYALLQNPRLPGAVLHHLTANAEPMGFESEMAIVNHPDASVDDLRWVATRARSGTARIAAGDALHARGVQTPGMTQSTSFNVREARAMLEDPLRETSEILQYLRTTLPDDVRQGLSRMLERRAASTTRADDIALIVYQSVREPAREQLLAAAVDNPATPIDVLRYIESVQIRQSTQRRAREALRRRGA